MKHVCMVFFSFIVLGTSLKAQLSLPIYEPFSSTPLGTLAPQNTWTGPTAAGLGAQVVDSALTYPGLFSVPSSYALRVGNQPSGAIQQLIFTGQTSKTYASFLIRIGVYPPAVGNATYYFTFGNVSTASGCMYVIPNADGTTFELGFNGAATVPTPANTTNQRFTLGATIMVVMAYTPGATGAGTVSAWVNPASANLGAAATEPTPTFADIAGGTVANLTNIFVRSGSNTRPMIIDEIRIAKTWGTVTSSVTVLPVSITDLKLSTKENVSTLSWNSASESNFDKYVVLYSTNGADFKEVGSVKGTGSNSNYAFNYTHSGQAYFKLKLVDKDGSFVYSKILQTNGRTLSITVGPNPVADRLLVSGLPDGTNTAILYTLSGVTLQAQTVKGANLTMLLSAYPAGTYLLKISNNGVHVHTATIVK
ncbi:MAG: T9SS C-terminal target domain-containing protein [Bacteroidetes bacterium]|nr:MAG: T9SS C-terminal target domain-containing protein [Bacteroidota bacterium]